MRVGEGVEGCWWVWFGGWIVGDKMARIGVEVYGPGEGGLRDARGFWWWELQQAAQAGAAV